MEKAPIVGLFYERDDMDASVFIASIPDTISETWPRLDHYRRMHVALAALLAVSMARMSRVAGSNQEVGIAAAIAIADPLEREQAANYGPEDKADVVRQLAQALLEGSIGLPGGPDDPESHAPLVDSLISEIRRIEETWLPED
jgi:hypothetical protein